MDEIKALEEQNKKLVADAAEQKKTYGEIVNKAAQEAFTQQKKLQDQIEELQKQLEEKEKKAQESAKEADAMTEASTEEAAAAAMNDDSTEPKAPSFPPKM